MVAVEIFATEDISTLTNGDYLHYAIGMSTQPETVRDLIALWPSRKALVDDLARRGFAMSLDRVHKWAQQGAIAAKYHAAIVHAGKARGLAVSSDAITQLHHAPDHGAAAEDGCFFIAAPAAQTSE